MADEKLRLLMIYAHPDDEVHAAGTAIKYARAGHSVTIVWLTRGDLGHMTMPREELARARTREAEAAAKVIGAEARLLDYPDSEVPYSREATMRCVDLIREYRPNIVITWALDRHPDHRNTHLNVVDAMHLAALPLLKTAFPPHDPNALFFQNLTDEAEIFVDISEVIEQKIDVARCHRTQYHEWLIQHQAGTDKGYPTTAEGMFDRVRDRSRGMGIRSGVQYAEGFVPFARKKPRALDLLPLD